jgi:peptide deformylase
MAILKVARLGHPVLRQKTRLVDKHEIRTPEFQKLIDDMLETMDEYSGIGLAAPQVHETRRLFVAFLDADGRNDGEPIALINPEVTALDKDLVEGWEGCLSIPDIRGRVPRSPHIKVSALNRDGKRIEIEARDFPARVIQHETDHLDGVLFFDRMRSFESLSFLEEYSRYHARRDSDQEDD